MTIIIIKDNTAKDNNNEFNQRVNAPLLRAAAPLRGWSDRASPVACALVAHSHMGLGEAELNRALPCLRERREKFDAKLAPRRPGVMKFSRSVNFEKRKERVVFLRGGLIFFIIRYFPPPVSLFSTYLYTVMYLSRLTLHPALTIAFSFYSPLLHLYTPVQQRIMKKSPHKSL